MYTLVLIFFYIYISVLKLYFPLGCRGIKRKGVFQFLKDKKERQKSFGRSHFDKKKYQF